MSTTELTAQRKDTAHWHQQQRGLWIGRLHDRPIGTIEQGRRFTYIDVDGNASRGHRTLSDAQRAHLTPNATIADSGSMTPIGRMLAIATTVAAFGTVSLLAAAAPVVL